MLYATYHIYSGPGLFRFPIQTQYKLTCGGRNSPAVLALLYALQLVHATQYKFETGTNVFGIEFSICMDIRLQGVCASILVRISRLRASPAQDGISPDKFTTRNDYC